MKPQRYETSSYPLREVHESVVAFNDRFVKFVEDVRTKANPLLKSFEAFRKLEDVRNFHADLRATNIALNQKLAEPARRLNEAGLVAQKALELSGAGKIAAGLVAFRDQYAEPLNKYAKAFKGLKSQTALGQLGFTDLERNATHNLDEPEAVLVRRVAKRHLAPADVAEIRELVRGELREVRRPNPRRRPMMASSRPRTRPRPEPTAPAERALSVIAPPRAQMDHRQMIMHHGKALVKIVGTGLLENGGYDLINWGVRKLLKLP